MRIVIRVLRVLSVVAVATCGLSAACAQSGTASVSNTSCANVKPPLPDPQDAYDSVSLYLVAPGAPQHQSVCRATEALAEGMVVIAMDDDRILADALGDPEPDTDIGEVSEFPYLAPGSTPTPGQPPPGPGPERVEGSQVYAAFIDPRTGVEYTYSSVADSQADMEAASAEWITSTVKPLLEQDASSAAAPPATNPIVDAPGNAKLVAAAEASVGTPAFDPKAWALLVEARIGMPNNRLATGTILNEEKELGGSGAIINIYRLNATAGANDYFLVDTRYTQTPKWAPYTKPVTKVKAWASYKTNYALLAQFEKATPVPRATLYDFAPKTQITGKTETFTVGGELNSYSSGFSASYSVTATQDSVDTTVKATLGAGTLEWNDTYHGFPSNNPPSTSITTFTGERLAIFAVPRTLNDVVPSPRYISGGVEFRSFLDSQVQAQIESPVLRPQAFGSWQIRSTLFAAEPQFSVSTRAVVVSRSKNNVTNPVIVDVTAQLPNSSHKVAWQVTNPLETIDAVASVARGSGKIEIYPKNPTDTSENGGTISVDSSPSGGADSLRNGPMNIKVTIEP
jgi:hypothetical protein